MSVDAVLFIAITGALLFGLGGLLLAWFSQKPLPRPLPKHIR